MSDFDTLAERIADVVAIPVTPFAADGTIDESTYRSLIRRLVERGVGVLTPNGNTGEFYALSPAERRGVVASTTAEVGEDALVIAGVGLDVATAIDDARYARERGAQLVMIHQPVHPYVSVQGWVEYHVAIAEAVPELGVVPYVRFPRLSGAYLGQLAARCPNVVGVKYSVPDAVHFASVAADARAAGGARMTWIAGLAEPYAPSYWQAGARGFTSGLVNVEPQLSFDLLRSLREGDYAGAQQTYQRIRAFEELRAADGSADNVTVVKDAMAQLGLCRRDVRPPAYPLSEVKRSEVAEVLRSWGLEPAAGEGTRTGQPPTA